MALFMQGNRAFPVLRLVLIVRAMILFDLLLHPPGGELKQ